MPCVLRTHFYDLKFYIHFNEHGKPHVHVHRNQEQLCKINLDGTEFLDKYGKVKPSERKYIKAILNHYQQELHSWIQEHNKGNNPLVIQVPENFKWK